MLLNSHNTRLLVNSAMNSIGQSAFINQNSEWEEDAPTLCEFGQKFVDGSCVKENYKANYRLWNAGAGGAYSFYVSVSQPLYLYFTCKPTDDGTLFNLHDYDF